MRSISHYIAPDNVIYCTCLQQGGWNNVIYCHTLLRVAPDGIIYDNTSKGWTPKDDF